MKTLFFIIPLLLIQTLDAFAGATDADQAPAVLQTITITAKSPKGSGGGGTLNEDEKDESSSQGKHFPKGSTEDSKKLYALQKLWRNKKTKLKLDYRTTVNNIEANQYLEPYIKSALKKNQDIAPSFDYDLNISCQKADLLSIPSVIKIEEKIVRKAPPICRIFSPPKFVDLHPGKENTELEMFGLTQFSEDEYQSILNDSEIDESTKSLIRKIKDEFNMNKTNQLTVVTKDELTKVSQKWGNNLSSMGDSFDQFEGVTELKMAMLNRLWPHLSQKQQMKALYECKMEDINDNKLFWKINDTKQKDHPRYANDFKKICSAENFNDLTPYISPDLFNEVALYAASSDNFISPKMAQLCSFWNAPKLGQHLPLPSASRDQLILAAAEARRLKYHNRVSHDLGLFNPSDMFKSDTPEYLALRSYTGSDYNSINAYEKWGSMGLYIKYRKELSDRYPDEKWDKMSWREQSDAKNKIWKDTFHTDGNKNIRDVAKELKLTLDKMEHFEGVTFSGQKLSGHIFKSFAPGKTFSPSFFMSTSTSKDTAISFLDAYPRAETDVSNTKPGETADVVADGERFLFVIKNKTGVPLTNQSGIPSEKEVLVRPDAKFRVTAVEPFVNRDGEKFKNVKVVYIVEE